MKIYIGMGSNVGNRLENLQAALNLLDLRAGTIVAISSVYETAPMYIEDQDTFLNMVALLDTKRDLEDLLKTVKLIETEVGRILRERYGPREIDIDLLATADGQCFQSDNLVLPHPSITERRFVLEPLSELAPNLKVNGRTVAEWLQEPEIQRQKCELVPVAVFVHRD